VSKASVNSGGLLCLYINTLWHAICIFCDVRKNVIYIVSAVAMLLLVISCPGCKGITSGLTKVADAITSPSAREVYAREFKGNKPVFDVWESAYRDAVNHDSLVVTVPYGEKGTFYPYTNHVYAYSINLKEGQVLNASVANDSLIPRVFIEVYRKQGNAFEFVESARQGNTLLDYIVKVDGIYKVVVQPEIQAHSSFFLSLNISPLYNFPVAGKGNQDIMSFWGMERDGGKRKHEGIDIFAKKGTPVVAAVKGSIGFSGERGIGGKQVWLRDGLFGKSLYYAHLDSIIVRSGENVKAGDTLGFVGNTGNARFTPPHLHFGIYRSAAVDPLPYVFTHTAVNEIKFPYHYKVNALKSKKTANLRLGPNVKSGIIGTLTKGEIVALLGQNNYWLHIKTAAGQKAFLHKSLVEIN
jgi:peptidoglycan LD-endopeptidase LytH